MYRCPELSGAECRSQLQDGLDVEGSAGPGKVAHSLQCKVQSIDPQVCEVLLAANIILRCKSGKHPGCGKSISSQTSA